MSEVNMMEKSVDMEQKCRCLFCGEAFQVKEIVFAKNEPNGASSSLVDTVFEKAIEEYKLIGGELAVEPPLRRFYTWDASDIETTEPGPGGSKIPKTVIGHLTKGQIHVARSYSLLANLDDEEDEGEKGGSNEITQLASVRLCPHCHMSLPDGFSTEKVRRIGLLGGSRCGKTTYMVVASKYMENYLGLLSDGLDLGEVEFVQECSNYLQKLYESQMKAQGAASTEQDTGSIIEKPVFPIIAHVKPSKEGYEPFYVIFQDIPGEFMRPEYKDKLINSAIPQSTDLISLVDINSLTWTRMQDDDTYGGFCELEPNELFKNFSVLSDALSQYHQLETIQLCLTKLDFWLDANAEVGQGTILARNGNEEHRGSISDRRLSDISLQVNQRLKSAGGKDQSGLMELMLRYLNLDSSSVHTAYTAVASRMVPGNENMFQKKGIDYSTSLNVIEPLLNIFSWANLLPHDSEERVVDAQLEGNLDMQEEEQTKQSLWKRLFRRN